MDNHTKDSKKSPIAGIWFQRDQFASLHLDAEMLFPKLETVIHPHFCSSVSQTQLTHNQAEKNVQKIETLTWVHTHTHTHTQAQSIECNVAREREPPIAILQQMMSNKSDDSITTNSQYETQVPWLLLNLLSSHCTQDPNCKVPMKLLELHQLFQFISCNIPCLHLNKHTHTHISTALRQQPIPSSLPLISSYTRTFVLDLTTTKNICIFVDKICYKTARKTTTRRGRVA
jgi:hypothetical protein